MKLVHFYEVYQTTVRILCVWPTSLHTIAKGLAKDPLVFNSRTLATVTYCQVATTPCPKHEMQCFDSRGEESKLTVPWSPRASATLCTTVSGESSGSLGASTSTKFIPSQRLQARRSTPTPFSGVSISFASRQKTSPCYGRRCQVGSRPCLPRVGGPGSACRADARRYSAGSFLQPEAALKGSCEDAGSLKRTIS